MEKKISFEDVFRYSMYSATLQEEFRKNLNISQRLINWAVKKVGLKEVEGFGKQVMELNAPVSLSEGYEKLFKGEEKTKKWRYPMALLTGALRNEEKLGYFKKLTITKPETIQFFTFEMDVNKWIISYRLPKQFFAIREPLDEELNKKLEKEERWIVKNPISTEEARKKMLELYKKLKLPEREIEKHRKQWEEDDKRRKSVKAEKGER